MNIKKINFNINNILKLIPHRYPFLLIDRVLDYEKYNFIRTMKNITVNDPCLQGHFPRYAIFPGVLLLESIAQSAVILACIHHPEYHNKNGFYCMNGIDAVRFKKFVTPGDQVVIDVKIITERKNIIFFDGIASVNNDIVCSAKIICTYVLNTVINNLH